MVLTAWNIVANPRVGRRKERDVCLARELVDDVRTLLERVHREKIVRLPDRDVGRAGRFVPLARRTGEYRRGGGREDDGAMTKLARMIELSRRAGLPRIGSAYPARVTDEQRLCRRARASEPTPSRAFATFAVKRCSLSACDCQHLTTARSAERKKAAIAVGDGGRD
jgi:hypothetical protein